MRFLKVMDGAFDYFFYTYLHNFDILKLIDPHNSRQSIKEYVNDNVRQ